MMRSEPLLILSAVLAVAAAVLGLFAGPDYCVIVLQIVSLAVFFYPSRSGQKYAYSDALMSFACVSTAGVAVLTAVNLCCPDLLSAEFWYIPAGTIVCQTFQVLQAFFVGIMAVMNAYCRGFCITKRWVIIAAMFVSLCYGVLTMFGNFFGMYFDGLEVIVGVGGYAADELNARMMSCAFVGVFASAVIAFVTTQALRGRGMECFLKGSYNVPEPPVAGRKINDRENTPGWGLDDAICILAFIVMMSMTVNSFLGGQKMTYEVNTGLLCGICCLFPMLLKHLRIMKLSASFNLLIVTAIFIHATGVLIMSYDTLKYYDTLTHTVASITVAMCVFYTLECYHVLTGGKVDFSGRMLTMMISLIMIGFSAYWETFEFLSDMLFRTGMQYSPFDTARDTVCNTFGSLLVILYSARYLSKHTPEDLVESFDLHPRLRKFIKDPFDGKSS